LPETERPDIRDGDMETISAPLDFLGVNYYTRSVVRADEQAGFVEVEPTLPLTDMGWEVFPQGLTDILISLNSRYRLPPVYVAENGAAIADAPHNDEIHDEERVEYMQQHLHAVTEAIRHGVNVSGFFYWSLMDNFEWSEGYLKRFGLVYVDYSNQRRIVKASGHAYRDFLRRRRASIDQESRSS
jgi:beta-glucosidase